MLLSPLHQQGKRSHREGNAWPKITAVNGGALVILPLGLSKGVGSSKDPQEILSLSESPHCKEWICCWMQKYILAQF